MYENAGDGALSVSYLGENDLPITRWFTKDQLGEMAEYAVECGRIHNTCLNINPRVEALDTYHIVWNCIGEFTPPMPQKDEKTA